MPGCRESRDRRRSHRRCHQYLGTSRHGEPQRTRSYQRSLTRPPRSGGSGLPSVGLPPRPKRLHDYKRLKTAPKTTTAAAYPCRPQDRVVHLRPGSPASLRRELPSCFPMQEIRLETQVLWPQGDLLGHHLVRPQIWGRCSSHRRWSRRSARRAQERICEQRDGGTCARFQSTGSHRWNPDITGQIALCLVSAGS